MKKLIHSHYKLYESILVDLKELFFVKRLKFNMKRFSYEANLYVNLYCFKRYAYNGHSN